VFGFLGESHTHTQRERERERERDVHTRARARTQEDDDAAARGLISQGLALIGAKAIALLSPSTELQRTTAKWAGKLRPELDCKARISASLNGTHTHTLSLSLSHTHTHSRARTHK
jgi:hypothetical protein